MKKITIICALALVLTLLIGTPAMSETSNPTVTLETTEGTIVIELYPAEAPKTVANFLEYAKSNYYAGTIFHRVIPAFMIQGGGFTFDMQQKETKDAIAIESNNGLKNDKGTVAMARTNDPNSATSQFFINAKDNDFLNFTAETMQGYGYTVFGKVTEGMDVVEKIEKVKTGTTGGHGDVPVEPIIIDKVSVSE